MTRRAPLALEAQWADESVPDLSHILTPRLGIDAAAFGEWLGPRLGMFRIATQAQRLLPSPAQEAEYAKATVAALRDAAQLLSPRAFPDRLDADVFMTARRMGADWIELRDRVLRDMKTASSLLEAVRPPTETRPEPAGAKPKAARDALIAAVVDRLTPDAGSVENAHDLARKILRCCGVHVPDDIKRAARTGRK